MNAHNANIVNGIGTRTAAGSWPVNMKKVDPPIRMQMGINAAINMCNQDGMMNPHQRMLFDRV